MPLPRVAVKTQAGCTALRQVALSPVLKEYRYPRALSIVQQRLAPPRVVSLGSGAGDLHDRFEIGTGIDALAHGRISGQQIDRGHVVTKLVNVLSPGKIAPVQVPHRNEDRQAGAIGQKRPAVGDMDLHAPQLSPANL